RPPVVQELPRDEGPKLVTRAHSFEQGVLSGAGRVYPVPRPSLVLGLAGAYAGYRLHEAIKKRRAREMYNPKADRFDPKAVEKACARRMAALKDAPQPVDQDNPLLDVLPKGLGGLLYLDSWRRHLPGIQRPSPRARPQ